MTATTRPILGLAMATLASACDYANSRDAAGFSAADAGAGHRLAEKPEHYWSIAERRLAHTLAVKYRKQLAARGIDVANLPDVPTEAPANALTASAPGICSACGGRIERGSLFIWGRVKGQRQHADAALCTAQPSRSDKPVSDATRNVLDRAGLRESAQRLMQRHEKSLGILAEHEPTARPDEIALPWDDDDVTVGVSRVRPSWRQWEQDGRIGNPPVPTPRTTLSARHLLSNTGPIATSLPGYREREPQLQLVDLVAGCIADGVHGAAEAGTGTGKSLGYMVPGLVSGHRAIVSTADKNLQGQLVNKDVPFLQANLPFDFTAALLKGRGNYVCRQRVAEINGEAQGRLGEEFAFRSAEAVAAWPALRKWIETTDSGDLETAPVRVPGDLAQDMTVGSDECTGRKCPFYATCFAEGAKQRAQDADVVIVNHALLLRDADVRANTGGMAAILPNATVLLLDEAHHLADIARDNFGIEVTATRWTRIGRRVERLAAVGKDASEADKATAERWAGRVALITALITPALDAIKARVLEAKESALRLGDESDLAPIARSLRQFADDMTDGRPSYVAGENDAEAWRKLAGAAERLADDVTALASPTADRDMVRYAELDGIGDRQRVKLICKPVDVADLLRERIFDRFDSVVSCSATIATHDRGRPSFDFWKRETGCPDPRELVVGSPFDYPTQSLLYLPADSAAFDPREYKAGDALDAYHERMAGEIERLVEISQGGAFLLFTSYRMLREMHGRLADKIGRRRLVLKHGEQSRPALVKAFREDGNAVLFGTKSFTEGVDISGDALRLVVIVGLPFAPPNDPMWEARCQSIERRGGKWFFDLALPTAIIALKQSFGRLIRSVDDRGVVAMLDGRLDASRTRYGPQIVRSLPPARPTRSLADVAAFYRAV